MELASFPSPSISALNVGPLTIHFYALCIIAGIIVSVWWGERRFIALGGAPGVVTDIAYWAVPSGIVGGRLYHLATSWNSERTFLDAIAIWRGGLGIWGAIGLGAGGAYLRYRMLRRKGSLHGVELRSLPSFATFMDALAPGIVIAQAIGRWGNWFNVELFGRPSSLPWALQVPANKRPNGFGDFETFHPTFLYESLWCIVVALLLIGVARKGFLRSGGIFLLYVASYSFGRLWIENLRIDTSEEIFGLRFNVWVSLCAFIFAALATFRRRNRPMAR